MSTVSGILNTARLRRRRSLFQLLLICLIPVAGCQTLRIEDARIESDQNWLIDGKTADRARFMPVRVVPPLEQVWIYNATGAFGPGSPLIVQDALIVANRKGEVHSVSLETGKKLGSKGFGQSIEGTPLIEHGVAYIPNAWGDEALSAYDLVSGTMKWRRKGAPIETNPLLLDNHLITVDVLGTIVSVDALSGEEQWSVSLGDKVSGQASPLALGRNRVFVAGDNGRVLMLNALDGSILWDVLLGAPVYADPSASSGILFIPTTRGLLYALESDSGSIAWTFDAANPEVHFGSVASDGNMAYVGASNGKLYALRVESGRQQWEFDGPDAFTASPLIVNDNIYIGSMGRMLYGFDRKSGALVWETRLKGRIKSALAAREGELIVLAEPHHVYLFREEEVLEGKNGTR